MRRLAVAAAVAVAATAIGGCGGGEDSAATGGERVRLVVSAAASLKEPLTECSRDLPGAEVRLAFAGSDELAAQIRRGVRPDVYAAANTSLPEQLAAEGLLRTPVAFVTNELVLAVPVGDARVRSLADLAAPGAKLVVGAESVPVGAYTRELLARLPPDQERAILANVRSEEPDVKGVVGKIAQGAADAGFVYKTDVAAAGDDLRGVALPASLQPTVTYGAGVVDGAPQPEAGQRYLDGLTSGACADALRAAGFGPPPSPTAG